MAEQRAAAPHAAVRGGDAGGLAAGDASRATGTSVATVTTSLAAVELCDEDVAMRCSAQSDAGSAADPEWEAVLAQLLAEEAEEEERSAAASSAVATTPTTGGTTTVRGRRMLLCRVWLGRWTSRSSVGTSGLAPLVEDSVCRRRLPPRWVITPATASKRASTFNKQESRMTACLHHRYVNTSSFLANSRQAGYQASYCPFRTAVQQWVVQ